MASIIATPSASDANSYGTLAGAATYFDGRPESQKWTGASEEDRTKALIAATLRLDQEEYLGQRRYPPPGTTTGTTQALKWPRYGAPSPEGWSYLDTVIPPCVEESCYELAFLSVDADLFADTGLEGFEELNLGPLKLKPRHVQKAGELPEVVQRKLAHVLATPPGAQICLHRG